MPPIDAQRTNRNSERSAQSASIRCRRHARRPRFGHRRSSPPPDRLSAHRPENSNQTNCRRRRFARDAKASHRRRVQTPPDTRRHSSQPQGCRSGFLRGPAKLTRFRRARFARFARASCRCPGKDFHPAIDLHTHCRIAIDDAAQALPAGPNAIGASLRDRPQRVIASPNKHLQPAIDGESLAAVPSSPLAIGNTALDRSDPRKFSRTTGLKH